MSSVAGHVVNGNALVPGLVGNTDAAFYATESFEVRSVPQKPSGEDAVSNRSCCAIPFASRPELQARRVASRCKVKVGSVFAWSPKIAQQHVARFVAVSQDPVNTVGVASRYPKGPDTKSLGRQRVKARGVAVPAKLS